jgi:hypothetical protein
MEYYFENASCTAYSIDRDIKLINIYGMIRKAVNDISVLRISVVHFSFNCDFSQISFAFKVFAKMKALQHTSQLCLIMSWISVK